MTEPQRFNENQVTLKLWVAKSFSGGKVSGYRASLMGAIADPAEKLMNCQNSLNT